MNKFASCALFNCSCTHSLNSLHSDQPAQCTNSQCRSTFVSLSLLRHAYVYISILKRLVKMSSWRWIPEVHWNLNQSREETFRLNRKLKYNQMRWNDHWSTARGYNIITNTIYLYSFFFSKNNLWWDPIINAIRAHFVIFKQASKHETRNSAKIWFI